MMIIIDFIKNYKKYLLIALLIVIGSYIGYLNIRLKSQGNEIEKLNTDIKDLQATNLFLYKDLTIKSNDTKIYTSFSNSDLLIDKITNDRLNDLEIQSINKVIADYYKELKK